MVGRNDYGVCRDAHAIPDFRAAMAIDDCEGVQGAVITDADAAPRCIDHSEIMNFTMLSDDDPPASRTADDCFPRHPCSGIDLDVEAAEAHCISDAPQ